MPVQPAAEALAFVPPGSARDPPADDRRRREPPQFGEGDNESTGSRPGRVVGHGPWARTTSSGPLLMQRDGRGTPAAGVMVWSGSRFLPRCTGPVSKKKAREGKLMADWPRVAELKEGEHHRRRGETNRRVLTWGRIGETRRIARGCRSRNGEPSGGRASGRSTRADPGARRRIRQGA